MHCAEVTAHRAPTTHAGIKWYHIGCVNAHLPDKGTGLIGYTSLTVGERERLDEVMHARKEKGEPVLLPFQEQAPHAPPGVLATVADGPAVVGEATQGTYESQGACAGPPDAGAQATGDRAQLLARPAAGSDAAKLEDGRGDEREEGLREEDEEYVDEEGDEMDANEGGEADGLGEDHLLHDYATEEDCYYSVEFQGTRFWDTVH